MKDFTLIISALPGGGKGSQGQLLQQQLKANYVATGDIIREMRNASSPLGKEIKQRYDQGIPQPDEVIVEVFKNTLEKLIAQNNHKRFILDGFPRSLSQAKLLDQFATELNIPKAYYIYLNVKPESVVKRLAKRLFCSKCYTSYLPAHPEYQTKICSKCGGKLTHRDQDQPEIIKIRLKKEKQIIDQLIKYYQDNQRIIMVDGEPSIEEVNKTVKQALNEKGLI